MSLVSQIYKRQQQRLRETSELPRNKPAKRTEVSKVQLNNLRTAEIGRTHVTRECASVAKSGIPKQTKRNIRKQKRGSRSATVPKPDDWEIVEILGRRILDTGSSSRTEYKVQWKNTWVAEEDVHAKDLLLEFEGREGF